MSFTLTGILTELAQKKIGQVIPPYRDVAEKFSCADAVLAGTIREKAHVLVTMYEATLGPSLTAESTFDTFENLFEEQYKLCILCLNFLEEHKVNPADWADFVVSISHEVSELERSQVMDDIADSLVSEFVALYVGVAQNFSCGNTNLADAVRSKASALIGWERTLEHDISSFTSRTTFKRLKRFCTETYANPFERMLNCIVFLNRYKVNPSDWVKS